MFLKALNRKKYFPLKIFTPTSTFNLVKISCTLFNKKFCILWESSSYCFHIQMCVCVWMFVHLILFVNSNLMDHKFNSDSRIKTWPRFKKLLSHICFRFSLQFMSVNKQRYWKQPRSVSQETFYCSDHKIIKFHVCDKSIVKQIFGQLNRYFMFILLLFYFLKWLRLINKTYCIY